MPGRRSTTTTTPTPIEETEPTAPAPQPEPAPAPQPEPVEPVDVLPDVPTAEEPTPETDEERVRRMVDEAMQERRPGTVFNLLGWQGAAARSAAAEDGDYPLTVHEAITEVTSRVEAIAKDRTASQGGSYKYRGIDDVFAALHPLLADVGLVILPGRVVESVWETRATSSGGTLNVARLRVRYRLIGPDGSTTSGEAWGEGGDSGDKATQKAHSQSYKSFCLQLFSIPTEDSARDEPDATNPPSRPFSAEELRRASTAWDAAQVADDLPALVGVRRRAEHLLTVPVEDGSGGLSPLSLLLDQRRLTLESSTGGAQ